MKIRYLIPVILVALLSACSLVGGEEPTPLPPEATPQPVQEEFSLTATTWMWVRLTDPTQQVQIEDPENYLLSFREDGSLVIKADCNQALADYSSDDSSLNIQVGPMTRAMCPEGSRSDQFVQLLNSSAIYFFQGGSLLIDLMADGGTLEFIPTDLEAGQAPVTEGQGSMTLIESAWQWETYTSPAEQVEIDKSEKYLVVFNANGILRILADCNLAQADYNAKEGSLQVEVGPATTELCQEGSRSEQMLRLLPGAARYFFEEGRLYIDLMADGGTLGFSPLDRDTALEAFQGIEETPSLTANTWQWVGFTDPLQQFQVEDPANYQLSFNADGTLNILADCNQAQGDYSLQNQSISLQIGPTTLAACPEGSRSEEFLNLLPFAAIYFFDGENLFIDLTADGGTLEFAPGDPLLTGDPWSWVAFTNPVEQFQVEDPAKYQLTFNPDNSLNIQADCNLAQGDYSLQDQSISIQVGPTTLAACPEGSRSEQLLKLLPGAAIIFFEEGDLFIDLMADGGTLKLRRLP